MNSNNYESSRNDKNFKVSTTNKSQKPSREEKSSEKIKENSINSLEAINKLSIDAVFINLKIFSRIKKYDKLCFSGDSLEIDNRYAAFIRRWLSDDDRSKSIEYINAIIQRVFIIVDETYNNEKNESITGKDINKASPFREENSNLLQRFSIELTNTMTGLENLEKTYDDDSLIKSNLDLIMDKIKIRIDKINKLLKIHI